MEDEDALFLQAMGHRKPTSSGASQKVKSPEPTPERSLPPEAGVADFPSAMEGLKGLKPLPVKGAALPAKAPAMAPAPPPAPPAPQASLPPPPPVLPPDPVAVPPSEPGASAPVLIHLAAGMAIEVDGNLDLRGHTTTDAIERLRERVQDGVFLGWRTFHVILGAAPELREAFLAFLGSAEARAISRYAQAPIPMGGSQAWIVYFAAPAAH